MNHLRTELVRHLNISPLNTFKSIFLYNHDTIVTLRKFSIELMQHRIWIQIILIISIMSFIVIAVGGGFFKNQDPIKDSVSQSSV